MILLLRKGSYRLIQTRDQIKILYLDDDAYAWVFAKDIGEILVVSPGPHKIDHLLALGRFRLYDIAAEPHLSDQNHLELLVGRGRWQGYLLPTGLPVGQKVRAHIIPTHECVTAS